MRLRGGVAAVSVVLAVGSVAALGPNLATGKGGHGLASFSWTMPSRLGHHLDGRRILDYPQSSAQVDNGPFAVHFLLKPPACAPGVKRRWTVGGQRVEAERVPGRCTFQLSFEREGVYDVGLHVEHDGHDDSSTHRVVVQDFLIVAIGDSVASGEGNPDNRDPLDPEWQDRRCHRSSLAGTARAAQAIEDADPRTSVTFVHLACSGATVPVGLLGGYKGAQRKLFDRPRLLPPQLDELEAIAREREVDAVLMSEGGNDIGFANVVAFCFIHRGCDEKRIQRRNMELPGRGKLPLGEAASAVVSQLTGRFAALAARLPESLPRDRVYALEYFDPTHANREMFCPDILGRVDQAELRWAYEHLLVPLNAQIRTAANANGWRYVPGVAAAFAGHGYCVDPGRWVRRLKESVKQQGLNPKGTLHPNEEGHAETAELIDAVLRPALLPHGVARRPRSPAAQGEQASRDGLVTAELAAAPAASGGLDTWVVVAIVVGGLALLAGAAVAIWRWRRRRR